MAFRWIFISYVVVYIYFCIVFSHPQNWGWCTMDALCTNSLLSFLSHADIVYSGNGFLIHSLMSSLLLQWIDNCSISVMLPQPRTYASHIVSNFCTDSMHIMNSYYIELYSSVKYLKVVSDKKHISMWNLQFYWKTISVRLICTTADNWVKSQLIGRYE